MNKEIEEKIIPFMSKYGKFIYENSPKLRKQIEICLTSNLKYKYFKEVDLYIKQLSNFGTNIALDKLTDEAFLEKINNFKNYLVKNLGKIIDENKLDDVKMISISKIFSSEIENISDSSQTSYFLFLSKISILQDLVKNQENLSYFKDEILNFKNETKNLSEVIPEIKEDLAKYEELFLEIEKKINNENENNFSIRNKRK